MYLFNIAYYLLCVTLVSMSCILQLIVSELETRKHNIEHSISLKDGALRDIDKHCEDAKRFATTIYRSLSLFAM